MKFWSASPFLVFLVSCLFSCQKPPPPQDFTPAEVPAYGDELVMGIFHEPGVLNPLVTDSTAAANLLDLISDSLVDLDMEEKMVPSLAERWEISEEGRIWTFYLRKGVLFHDGVELTAEDVRFTFEQKMKRKGHGSYPYLKNVKKFSAPGRYVFRMEFSRHDHAFLGILLANIVPRHLLKDQDLDHAPFNRNPIGTGPFRFVSRRAGEIVLEANGNYFKGRPYLNRIRIRTVHSPQAYIDLATGKLDLILGIEDEYYAFLSQLPDIHVYRKRVSPFLYTLCFNAQREMLRSPKIRRAISGIIDRKKIITLPFQEKLQVANGPFPPWEDDRYLFLSQDDPEEARKILSQEKKRVRFAITASENDLDRKIVEEIRKELSAAGIEASSRFLPVVEMVKTIKKKDFDLVFLPFSHAPSLFIFEYYTFWHSSGIADGINFSSYSNPAADRALDQIRFSLDETERQKAFWELQRVLREDPPAAFLFWRYMPSAIHKRFRGFIESGHRHVKTFREIWVPKEEQKHE